MQKSSPLDGTPFLNKSNQGNGDRNNLNLTPQYHLMGRPQSKIMIKSQNRINTNLTHVTTAKVSLGGNPKGKANPF